MEIAVENRSLSTTIINEKSKLDPESSILLMVDDTAESSAAAASTSGVKICIADMYDEKTSSTESNESSPTSKLMPENGGGETNSGLNINNKYLLSSSFSSTSTSPSISSHSFASTTSSTSSSSTASNRTNTPSTLSLALSPNNNNNNNQMVNNNHHLSEESTTIMNNTDSGENTPASNAAFRVIPASISFSTSAYHESKQQQQQQQQSSHLAADNYSLGTPVSPGCDSLPTSTSYHHYHPHGHAHRHRHAHHHRNYHGSIRLRNGINDLDESTDDPDSFSIPVLHLSPDDSKYGFDYRLKESNDYDEDELLNISNNQQHQNNQLVPEHKESNTETTTTVSAFRQYYSESEQQQQQQQQQQQGDLQPIADRTTTSRSSFVKSGSIRHHRSTPNLANLDDNDSTGEEKQIGENSPLIVSDLNEIRKMPTTTSTNLINKNFPSNLELSTNNEHLLYSAGVGLNNLLNNQTSEQQQQHQFDDDIGCSFSGMCSGKLGGSPAAANLSPSSSASKNTNNTVNNQHSNKLHIINNNSSGTSANSSTGGSSLISNAVMVASAMGIAGANAGIGKRVITQRYKLIVEGDVHVCKLPHTRNVFSKILNSKLLRRWKAHRLVLTDTEIYSTTQIDYMESSIPYHTIVEVSPISKWEPGQKYCLRVATIECHYLIQTNNMYVRDQWIHSIIWKKHKFKSERVLRSAVRSEVLIKEIKHMIEMSLTTPIEDSEIFQYPLELVSELLQKHQHHLPKTTHEEIIVSLSPLLEKNHPSPEICDFFSRHCRDSPRSHIVIEMFSPVVQRILKHNGDFGRYPRMRLFVQDYLMALCSQNDGLQTVQTFVKSMHSPSSQCPFPRVLPNFVSVCLAAIHGCFEQRKNYKNNQPPAVKLTEQEKEDQLICHTTMMLTMSNFEDWRVNLAQLLQSVPFPDQALTNEKFIKIIKKVIENFAKDPRCEVHQTLLGIREGKEGWFENFCPGNISCDDDGELFSIMLKTLVGCCCKKKRFLLGINKLLSQIMVLAVREVPCCIETLCAMLDLNGVENPDNKLQIISTLQSTPLGLKHYAKVCERQMQLRELQQKGGPRKLTLPSRSTDEDLAKLLLSGSFGNLECLSLAFTNVTSACAEYLIKLPSLRYLNLWSTKFGDEGLELISEHLQRLQVLNLCETPVTDKGLSCLASMKQLRKLNLNSTNLSALTFEGLKECLPALQECDIRYTDAW